MTLHFEPYRQNVDRMVEDGGTVGWCGTCPKCKWMGPTRQTWDAAKDDAQDHEVSHAD